MFSRPGQSQGMLDKLLCNYLINSVTYAFPLTALRRRHGQTVKVSSFCYKIDYVIGMKVFLNPEEHQNCISGLKVTAILLKR